MGREIGEGRKKKVFLRLIILYTINCLATLLKTFSENIYSYVMNNNNQNSQKQEV